MKKVKLDIIRYARKVFKDTGRPPSVKEILKEFKISSRTFYKYFPSINELYRLANIPIQDKPTEMERKCSWMDLKIAKEEIRIELNGSFYKLYYYLQKFREDYRADAIRRSACIIYRDVEELLNKAKSFRELKIVRQYIGKVCMLYEKWFKELRGRYLWKQAEEEYIKWAIDEIAVQIIWSIIMGMKRSRY